MSVNSPGERITDVILSNRLTKKEFAELLGYNPSYITQICLNVKSPSDTFVAKVEERFGIPADWILRGVSEDAENVPKVMTGSPLKQAIVAKIERMDSESELRAVMSFIKCYEDMSKPRDAAFSENRTALSVYRKLYRIPIKGVVAGGMPITAYEESGETVETTIFADSALYLKGKSMEPDYPDGSLLLIKENAYITNGDVVVALIMKEAEVAEATCKVYGRRRGIITLSPINSAFEKQVYSGKDGEIKIFGKVIGVELQ